MERIAAYLAELRAHLPRDLGRRYITRITREIEEHLLEGWDAAREAGLSSAEALQQALARCGAPAVIAQGFVQAVDARRARVARRSLPPLLAGIFVLVTLELWRYPTITGTARKTIAAICLYGVLLALYAWVVSGAPTPHHRALWRGARIGALVGAGTLVLSLADTALGIWLWQGRFMSPQLTLTVVETANSFVVGIPLVAWLVMTLREGLGQPGMRLSLWCGLWSGMGVALVSTLGILLTGLLIPQAFSSLLWHNDPTCMTTRDLAACEMGDALGGVLTLLCLAPLGGIGLGALGGVFAAQPRRVTTTGTILATTEGAFARTLGIFVVSLLIAFLGALAAQL